MRISSQQMNLIAKSGNTELLNKIMMTNGSVSQLLTKEESSLLQRTKEQEKQGNICPSAGLVFVHTLDKEPEQDIELMKPSVSRAEMMYHIYNMGYDKPLEETMDELTKYAKGIGIGKNKLRFAVENIDKDYLVKYESQYSEAAREFLSQDDLVSIVTDPEMAVYYQEQEKDEEEEEEEESLEAYGLSGFSF